MADNASSAVAVVTGAGRGLGRAISARLAACGFHVVAGDITGTDATVGEIRSTGGSCEGMQLDVSTPDGGVAELVQTLRNGGRRCDVLVNNAGIEDHVDWDDLDFDRWRAVMRVNLDGPFLMCQAVVPMMRQQGWGRIVNIASGAVLLPMPQFVAYRASKMGLIGLTRSLAVELGPHGITVNAVAPGMTRTSMTLDAFGEGALESAARARPIRRVAEPNDIAGMVEFLASPDADFITGQTILVNGGGAFL